MKQLQLLVSNSPFTKEQSEILNRLLPTLTDSQRIWLSGYLAAPQSTAVLEEGKTNELQPMEQPASQKLRDVTILYGSETGNAQYVAGELEQKVKQLERKVTVAALDDFKPKNLKKVEDLFIVTATHGEGDPPDNAVLFYEFLFSRKAPKLDHVRFSVLALGDQSYEFFCQTGKDFDERLEELGAERIHPRVDCDVDFDEPAAEWMDGVVNELKKQTESETQTIDVLTPSVADKPVYSRANPFYAEVLENINLNGRGSNKETHHLELSLEGSGLEYEPGDSIGIFPQNDPERVDTLIEFMNWNPDESVSINNQGEQRSLREALLSHFEISRITTSLLDKAASVFGNEALQEFVSNSSAEEKKAYINGRDVIDLLKDYPPEELEAETFAGILRKLPVRLYSITSSYEANPDEVHLLIGKSIYPDAEGEKRVGVCSGYCIDRVEPGDTLPIYVHQNPNFKLPEDEETPIIMVGAGTGVAPFRSFMEEREEKDMQGKSWLFFGDQHFATDFLYQAEWQNWLKEGVLTRMDVAFSRDTEEKVYVQHRMLERSKELYEWLEEGAYFYVCGDEKHMAKDVHHTLITILIQEGGFSEEEAENYLSEMRQQKRYQRDVY